LEQFRRGLDLSPEDPALLAALAKTLAFMDHPDQAIESGRRALRLNPLPPNWYLWNLGIAHYLAGFHDKSISILKQTSGHDQEARLYLIASLIRSDHDSEAVPYVLDVMRANPTFNLADYVDPITFVDPSDKEMLISDLLDAGLPQHVKWECLIEPTLGNCL
jgi:tetratricopeptide (TPR) repeat protein